MCAGNQMGRIFVALLCGAGGVLSLEVSLAAALEVATITRIEGDVKLLTKPTGKPTGPSPQVLYEGKYFHAMPAKVGDSLAINSIIQTGSDGKARMVYKNGDQLTTGPGTSMRIRMKPSGSSEKTIVDVISGKVRSMVRPDGPRSGMEVNSRSAVLGVRGTDFYVSAYGSGGAPEVTVMRGSVAARQADVPNAKPVDVPAGSVLVVPAAVAPPKDASGAGASAKSAATPMPAAKLEPRPATKEELLQIQTASVVKKTEAPAENKSKVDDLEKTAVEATIQDIKKSDPKLYEQLQREGVTGGNIDNTDKIHSLAVKEIFVKAPSSGKVEDIPESPTGKKPTGDELKSLNEDVYEKYYDVTD